MHYQQNGQELEHILGDGEGQKSLVCCSSWCLRVGNDLVTERNNYCSINVVTMAIFVLAFLTNGVITFCQL